MKASGFCFTIVDNCLVISLNETNEIINNKNVQEYLKKRGVSSKLVNQTFLDINEGSGYLRIVWFCRD